MAYQTDRIPAKMDRLSNDRIPQRGEKLGGNRATPKGDSLSSGRIPATPRLKEKIKHKNSGSSEGFKDHEYMGWLHSKHCLVCNTAGVHAHHIKDHTIVGRDDRFIIPLCPDHHNMGTFSPHGSNSVDFYKQYPKEDLIKLSQKYYKEFLMRNQNQPEVMISDNQLRTIVEDLVDDLGEERATQWIRTGEYSAELKARAMKLITRTRDDIEGAMAEGGDISDMGGY